MVNVRFKTSIASEQDDFEEVPLEFAEKQSALVQLLSENFSQEDDSENVIEVPCASKDSLRNFVEFLRVRALKDVPPPPSPLKSLDFAEASIPVEREFLENTVLEGKGMMNQQRLIDLMVVADFMQHEGLVLLCSAFVCCKVSVASLVEMKQWSTGESENNSSSSSGGRDHGITTANQSSTTTGGRGASKEESENNRHPKDEVNCLITNQEQRLMMELHNQLLNV